MSLSPLEKNLDNPEGETRVQGKSLKMKLSLVSENEGGTVISCYSGATSISKEALHETSAARKRLRVRKRAKRMQGRRSRQSKGADVRWLSIEGETSRAESRGTCAVLSRKNIA